MYVENVILLVKCGNIITSLFFTNVTALFAFIANISLFQIVFPHHDNYRLMALLANAVGKITIVHKLFFHSLNITKTSVVFSDSLSNPDNHYSWNTKIHSKV